LKVTLCGIGTIGSQVGLNLLLSRPELDLRIVDRDRVERRNLATQIYEEAHIGLPKVDAFFGVVYNIIEILPKLLSGEHGDVRGMSRDVSADLVIDALDNYESRDAVTKASVSRNIVHLGFSPERVASILWDETFSVAKTESMLDDDVCELPALRYWLQGVTGIMTANILGFLESGKKQSAVIDRNFQITHF
jgi:molybdopterin-synthase adenylyltransferase